MKTVITTLLLIIAFAACSLGQTLNPVAQLYQTTNPALCTVNQLYFNTSTTPGTLYQCTATNTWTQLTTGGSGPGSGPVTPIAVSTGAATLAFTCTSNINTLTIIVGTTLTLPTPPTCAPSVSPAAGQFHFQIKNTGPVACPNNIAYAGAAQSGLPTCINAQTSNDVTTVHMHWDGPNTTWVSDGADCSTCAGLPTNAIPKASGQGVAIPATQTDVSALGYIAGGGSANAQTVTLSPAITALTNGLQVCWLPIAANTTTTPTLAVNGLTAKTLTKTGGALAASDLLTTWIACARYDGTNFELGNPQTTSAGGGPSLTTSGLGWSPLGINGNSQESSVCTLAAPCYWGWSNPFSGGLKITTLTLVGFTGQSTKDGIVFIMDKACTTLIATSNTNNNATVGNQAINFTFGTPPTLTDSYYYVGIATNATTGDFLLNGQANGTGYFYGATSTKLAFSGNTAATQGGGAGTTITAPASCGTRTAFTSNTAAATVLSFMVAP